MAKPRRSDLRWPLLIFALLIGPAPSASAEDAQPQQLTIPTSDAPVSATLFAAPGSAKRPAVIILHGANGITSESTPHFARYALSLAAHGIDAYVVSYFSGSDAMLEHSADRQTRSRLFAARIGPWTKLVAEVISFILDKPDSTGKIGLLGLSNGGFLSVAESSLDPRVSALVVLYGGIPPQLDGKITHLPPLLDLHGDADRVIPLSMGNALVNRARALGVPVQQIVYPGEGHGFEADPDKPDSHDATERAVGFLVQTLKQ